jgi:hypothetical protein
MNATTQRGQGLNRPGLVVRAKQRALSQRQRNRLRQAEREWIKQKDALPKDEQDEFTNERTSYLRSFGGKN